MDPQTAKPSGLRRITVLAMPLFWATLAFTLFAALSPAAQAPTLMPWDKAEHFTAFYVLTGIASAAFPRRPLWLVGLLLSGLGGAIELVQGQIGRDCDVFDWVADSLGILAVIAPSALPWWRAWRRGLPADEG
jgi:VanZ family protein